MWMPTHVQVTVQRATDLLTKGKNNTNDCLVTIALGKIKYQTSVKERAEASVEWHEECELEIPDQGNTAVIVLTALHRNFLGVDEFLGRVEIPLNELDVYERPKNRWYTLQSKPGKEGKRKERGKLEVKIDFIVKSGSLTDLKKEKHKSSMGHLSHLAQSVGGSLLSISSIDKRKGIKNLAKSLGTKMHFKNKRKELDVDDASSIGSVGSLQRRNGNFNMNYKSKQTKEDADPGVVSEDDDDFTFDDLSHKSSESSLNHAHRQSGTSASSPVTSVENLGGGEIARKNSAGHIAPLKPPRGDQKYQDEWETKLFGKQSKNLLKPNSSESLNKKPWESPKLEAQIEEDEAKESQIKSAKPVLESPTLTNSPILRKKEEKESMLSKFKKIRKGAEKLGFSDKYNSNERIIIGVENEVKVSTNNRISNEVLQKFVGKSREDLILLVCNMQGELDHNRKKMSDLEDYLDELLLRVMETTPKILQIPYVGCKMANNKLL
ncbi:hypothetical protein FQR65_LT00032 [Abscondita terminalis]|nr:hypothetical protein FQR65_LT00032 [Abscondita terminalis]